MKSVPALVLTFILLTGFAASAMAFENGSVVGQVPDRVVVTLKPGVAFSTAKATEEKSRAATRQTLKIHLIMVKIIGLKVIPVKHGRG